MSVISERATGFVKFFDAKKGFGFIERDGKADVFLHVNALKRSGLGNDVKPGDKLEFDLVPSDKVGQGPKAGNIKRLQN